MSAEGAALHCCPSIDVPRLWRSTSNSFDLSPALRGPIYCRLSGLDREYRKIRVSRQKLVQLGSHEVHKMIKFRLEQPHSEFETADERRWTRMFVGSIGVNRRASAVPY